ncbi:hypothetical protein M404DRAFT_1009200, partial [Pisolithus tinctorius Marx 270]
FKRRLLPETETRLLSVYGNGELPRSERSTVGQVHRGLCEKRHSAVGFEV